MNGLLSRVPDSGMCEASSPTESFVDGLKRKKFRLESQLKDVNDALTALESNPEITNVLELILKTGR